jgi:hypothetical protein
MLYSLTEKDFETALNKSKKDFETHEAKVKKDREEKAKLEKELKEKNEVEQKRIADEKKKKDDEIKAKKLADKSPDKEKLQAWINSFNLVEFGLKTDEAKVIQKVIIEKFNKFKEWADTQLKTL